MLTEEQRQNIAKAVNNFQAQVHKYTETKETADECQNMIDTLESQLSLVAQEERQMETAADVLYRVTKQISKTKEIQNEICAVADHLRITQEELNQLEPELLTLLRNLPLPIALDNFEINNTNGFFHYFEGLQLGEEAINVISTIIRQNKPLTFDEVTILPDKVVIRNVANRETAVQKLIAAIQTFRIRVDDLAKSYENIDALIERLIKSKVYPAIIQLIATKGALSVQDISSALNVDERVIYDGCYNLTRNNWSPNPIQKVSSGQYQITLAGKILFDRLSAKYPQPKETGIS
jgi:hypothetical protein